MEITDEVIVNLDNYIDDLEYFKPQFYTIGMREIESLRKLNSDQLIKIVKTDLHNKSNILFEVLKEKIDSDEDLRKFLLDELKPEIVIEKPIISFKRNVDKFDIGSDECFYLDLFEKDIINNFNNRLVGLMTTVTYPPSYSFHDSWYIVNYQRELCLNIVREYAFMAVSTIEYMHSGNPNYKMKGKKQVEWYKKLLSEPDIRKQLLMLEPTGIKDNDFGIERLTDAKMPYLYYPGGNQSCSNINNLILFYRVIRQKFGFIHDKSRRIISKDFYRSQYFDQPDTFETKYDPNRKCDIQVPVYSPYFCTELNTVSRKDLLQSLFNYFNVVLFNRRNSGENGDFFDKSMVDFCQFHYRRIRDIYNSNDGNKLNLILNEYFPAYTVEEIGVAKGVFEIDKGKHRAKVSKEEYDNFIRTFNYYKYSNNYYIEFTFFSFLAFQHMQNRLSNVGYPHIHIYFLIEAVDHKTLLNISREINTRISFVTGLCKGRAVKTDLKNEETYLKGVGYVTKNHSSSFVDKMLTQLDENGDRIRSSMDPIIYVDYYNEDLYNLTDASWLMILGEENDGRMTNWSYAKDYLPLKLRRHKTDKEIYRSVIRRFLPEKITDLNILEERELVEDKIFNIRFSPTNTGDKNSIWINYLQHYMVDRRLVVCDGFIYQKRDEGKYSFELYRPKNSEGEISTPNGWDSSVECFVKSFANNESPRLNSEVTEKYLIKILNICTPGYVENKTQFPCIKINFRLAEYDDFILDIINRCTYSKPPKNQYCYNYFSGISRSNIFEKLEELLSTSEVSFEDFESGRTKRTPLGLLRHLNLYNYHSLSMLYETLNVRFYKNTLLLFAGDPNSYKSKMLLLAKCFFPEHKIGSIRDLDKFDIGHNISGKCVIICEESNKNLDKIAKEERAALLALAGGEQMTGDKKFKDPKTFSTLDMSVAFCANINDVIGDALRIGELRSRLTINVHRANDRNPGIITEAEFRSVLGELVYLVCMISLSRDYFKYQQLPILHHYDEVPEPLERLHRYFLNNCESVYLVKKGEPDRSALDIRDFIYTSLISHSFYNSNFRLPDKPTKTSLQMCDEIICESANKKIETLTEDYYRKREITMGVNKNLDKKRVENGLSAYGSYNPMAV